MKKVLVAAVAAVTAAAGVIPAGVAAAQPAYYGFDRYRDSDRDGRPDYREWNRDRDRDGRPDQYDRYDNRRSAYRDSDRDGRPDYREWNQDRDRDGRPDQYDRYDNRRYGDRGARSFRYYGGHYGYSGYDGRWRTGQRYPYYNSQSYIISDYNAYGLPPPRPGYRYYRDNNGDVVMAAIASGIIGLIIGSVLSDNNNDRYYDYRR
jgi:Ni/Co efflux regulator RcnB